MKQKKLLIGLFMALLMHCGLFSQVESQWQPKSFPSFLNPNRIANIPIVSIKPFDMEEIKKEDALDEKLGNPSRFGRSRSVDIGLSSGEWHTTNIGKSWQIGLSSKKAKGFMLVFDELVLPEGAELFIYNVQKTMLFGPVKHSDTNDKSPRFSSDLIEGDSIILELIESPKAFKKSKLHIESVLYAYDTPSSLDVSDGLGLSLSCHRDIVCPEGSNWTTQSNAVAMIFDPVLGRRCSGTMLNNACNNLRPTLLTAFHCADFNTSRALEASERNQVQNWVFRFGFKNMTCGGNDHNSQWQTIEKCSISAESENTDGLLVQLNTRPSIQSGITYAGWTTNLTNITQVTALHHPEGNPMKISMSANNQTPIFQTLPIDNFTLVNALQTVWNTGAIEKASSGCSYFDQNQRVVAQHVFSEKSCTDKRTRGGTIANAFPNGFGAVLTDDPSVTQTNTVGIPSLSIPDVICGQLPLNFNLNGFADMGVTNYTSQGVQFGVNPGWQLFVEPIPGYSGNGFADFQLKPIGIACNEPLIMRKDFQVGLPNPTVTIHHWGGCETWLTASGPPSYSYMWTVYMSDNSVRYFIDQSAMIHYYNSGEGIGYELTVTNQCGSTTVYGGGLLGGEGCTADFKGKDAGISALKAQSFKPTLSISPNPAAQEVTLNIKDVSPMLLNTLCDVLVLNQMGQAVINQKMILENAIRLDINSLANGFYVVQVKGENSLSLSQKLIVNKK